MTVASSLTRRRLLGTAAVAVAGATLSSCSRGGNAGPAASGPSTLKLPDYVEFSGVKPDLPATAVGAPSGFTSYPAKLVDTVTTAPLTGQAVAFQLLTYNPLPTPKADNAAWKAIEQKLGGTLDLSLVPASDYATKFQTTLAGKQLPDGFLLESETMATLDNLPKFFDATCADLTPHLSGAAVKTYPNLAAIPTQAWQDCVWGNKIYAVPIPRGVASGMGYANVTMLEAAGAKMPTTPAELLEACKAVTSDAQNRYAIVNMKGWVYMTALLQMHGVPYVWKDNGGKLVRNVETDEYVETMEFALKLVAAKVFVPGSEGFDGQTRQNTFLQRRAAFIYNGLPAFSGYRDNMPGQDVRPVTMTSGKAAAWADNTTFAITAFKKADEARVKQLLGVANFFAAPFGSSENLLVNFGVAGVDHTMTDGKPVRTEKGKGDLGAPWQYIASPGQIVYDGDAAFVKKYVDATNILVPKAIKNPVKGFVSATNDKQGGKLDQALMDVRNDILSGRKQMSEWAPAVDKWRKDGGDTIRGEYEAALAAR